MQIWVDADACPKIIKEILYRAANRTHTFITFVSHQAITTPSSPYIQKLQVNVGLDAADDKIVALLAPGDLVITADIPLADLVITKGGHALNPRGELYSASNIKQRLSMRNFSDGLRSSGGVTGGPPKISQKEVQQFANCLDRLLR
jgi:uncharacterized protein YaiI (UPF0178 family)